MDKRLVGMAVLAVLLVGVLTYSQRRGEPLHVSGFIEADEKFSAREPGERAAAGEALQINDEVEVLRAEPADAAQHFWPMLRLAPAPSLEADDAGQITIAFDERSERGINPPENFRVAEVLLQQTQDGQGVDDIAEGTGFEDENFQA